MPLPFWTVGVPKHSCFCAYKHQGNKNKCLQWAVVGLLFLQSSLSSCSIMHMYEQEFVDIYFKISMVWIMTLFWKKYAHNIHNKALQILSNKHWEKIFLCVSLLAIIHDIVCQRITCKNNVKELVIFQITIQMQNLQLVQPQHVFFSPQLQFLQIYFCMGPPRHHFHVH